MSIGDSVNVGPSVSLERIEGGWQIVHGAVGIQITDNTLFNIIHSAMRANPELRTQLQRYLA